jgi:hypothetical protein
MSNARTGDRLCEDADHDAKHGSAAVEELCSLELLHVDQMSRLVLEPGFITSGICHGGVDGAGDIWD